MDAIALDTTSTSSHSTPATITSSTEPLPWSICLHLLSLLIQSYEDLVLMLQDENFIKKAIIEQDNPLALDVLLTGCCDTGGMEISILLLDILVHHSILNDKQKRLKYYFKALEDVLMVQDEHQEERIEYGVGLEHGLLAVMKRKASYKSNARRQEELTNDRCMKCAFCLIHLIEMNPSVEDWAIHHVQQWEWVIQWVQATMPRSEITIIEKKSPFRIEKLNQFKNVLDHYELFNG